jgi:single-strand DNA-binding protein
VCNKAAEICERHLRKGDKLYVEGRIKSKSWTDENDQKHYMTEILVQEFTFLTPKRTTPDNERKESSPRERSHVEIPVSKDETDDLPF